MESDKWLYGKTDTGKRVFVNLSQIAVIEIEEKSIICHFPDGGTLKTDGYMIVTDTETLGTELWKM